MPAYFECYGEFTKKSGISLLEPDKSGLQVLLWDDAKFGALSKAKNAPVYLYSRQTHRDPDDYYLAGANLSNGKRVTDMAAQVEQFAWSSGRILINYTSAKGDKLQGALYLPANYEKGKQYPTIVSIYEKLSQNLEYLRPAHRFDPFQHILLYEQWICRFATRYHL